jgi:hypothetical protein
MGGIMEGFNPPICFMWKATFAALHWSRSDLAQSGSNGRKPGPDSPPAITQWMGFSPWHMQPTVSVQ